MIRYFLLYQCVHFQLFFVPIESFWWPNKPLKLGIQQHHPIQKYQSFRRSLGSQAIFASYDDDIKSNNNPATVFPRRKVIVKSLQSTLITTMLSSSSNLTQRCIGKEIDIQNGKGILYEINDPNTYPALVYKPNGAMNTVSKTTHQYPVIIVLHGAGKNELDVWNLANSNGEHAGLIPSLLNSSTSSTSLSGGMAPSELYDNFIVIAPYSIGKRSFYEEPRSKILQFVKWACSSEGINDNDIIDKNRLFLFGFRYVKKKQYIVIVFRLFSTNAV